MPEYLKYVLLFGSSVILIIVLLRASKSVNYVRGNLFWIVFSLVFLALGSFPVLAEQLAYLLGFEKCETFVFVLAAVMLVVWLVLFAVGIARSKKSENAKEPDGGNVDVQ